MKITTDAIQLSKDIIWRKKVPAEDLVGKREVTLKYRRHLSAEVVPPAELLQDPNREHEDLAKVFLLQEVDHRDFWVKSLLKMCSL